jgi:hypothetical protein
VIRRVAALELTPRQNWVPGSQRSSPHGNDSPASTPASAQGLVPHAHPWVKVQRHADGRIEPAGQLHTPPVQVGHVDESPQTPSVAWSHSNGGVAPHAVGAPASTEASPGAVSGENPHELTTSPLRHARPSIGAPYCMQLEVRPQYEGLSSSAIWPASRPAGSYAQ